MPFPSAGNTTTFFRDVVNEQHCEVVDTINGTVTPFFDNTENLSVVSERQYKSTNISSNGIFPTAYGHCSQSFPPSPSLEQSGADPAFLGVFKRYTSSTSHWVEPGADALLDVTTGNGRRLHSNANVENRIITECFARLADSKVDFGISLGEASRTARTVASLSVDALRLLRAIKTKDFAVLKDRLGISRVSDIPNTLAKRWLEFQYGVKPILRDIHGASEIMNKGLEQSSDPKFIEATRGGSHNRTSSNLLDNVWVDSTASFGYHCKVRARVNDADLRAMSLLGLVNPASVAWELTPYSFVVDWMIPVGTWLRAESALAGLDYEFGYLSCKGVCSYERPAVESSIFCQGSSGSNAVRVKSTGFGRRHVTSQMIFPYYKNPLSLSHAATFAALIQVLR